MAKIKLTNGIVVSILDSVASGLVGSGVAEYVAEAEPVAEAKTVKVTPKGKSAKRAE